MKLNGINVNEEDTITDPTLLMEVSGYTHERLFSFVRLFLLPQRCKHLIVTNKHIHLLLLTENE